MALLSHRLCCAYGMVGLTVRFVGAALFLRCPIYRYIRIMCILMQIYCIAFMLAYSIPLCAYTHEIQILPVYTAIFSYIFTIVA